jgi:hypothetical protein
MYSDYSIKKIDDDIETWHTWYVGEDGLVYCNTIDPCDDPFSEHISRTLLDQLAAYELLGNIEPIHIGEEPWER